MSVFPGRNRTAGSLPEGFVGGNTRKKIAAFGSFYRSTRFHAGAAEGCDLLILPFKP
jgi:hypothetical protein